MATKEAAMIELTEQQQQVLDVDPEPRLIDPRTTTAYVLVRADIYERLRGLLAEDEGLDMRQVAVLVERAMREDDADDPTSSSTNGSTEGSHDPAWRCRHGRFPVHRHRNLESPARSHRAERSR